MNIKKKVLVALLSTTCLIGAMALPACGSKDDEDSTESTTTTQTDKGAKGATGDTGASGKDGATWTSGTQDPDASQGASGDYYLNTTTYDLYLKGATSWTKIGNLKGAKGDKGDSAVGIVYASEIDGNTVLYFSDGSSQTVPKIDTSFEWNDSTKKFTDKQISLSSALAEYGVDYKLSVENSGVYKIEVPSTDVNYDITINGYGSLKYTSENTTRSVSYTLVKGQEITITCKGTTTNGTYSDTNYTLKISETSAITDVSLGNEAGIQFSSNALQNKTPTVFAFMPTGNGEYQIQIKTTDDTTNQSTEIKTFLSISIDGQTVVDGSHYANFLESDKVVLSNRLTYTKDVPILITVTPTDAATTTSTTFKLLPYTAN